MQIKTDKYSLMGWSIKQNKEKFRVYSTNVDDYITDWLDKDELIRFLFWNKFERLMEDMLKDIICFPHGWSDKSTGKYLSCESEKLDEFYDVIKDRDKKFQQFFLKIKESGISIDLKDISGVDIHTLKD